MKNFILESHDPADYLQHTEVIDFDNPTVSDLANELRKGISSELEWIKKTYEYVRDRIAHSADVQGITVTYKASDVLTIGEGICYAKSHLLAALLRKNNIPTGFCYQLLRLTDDSSPLILHGLNGVYLRELNQWIRLDARGNNETVNAQFAINHEQLAFCIRPDLGEIDYPYLFIQPDDHVLHALQSSQTVNELWGCLPTSLKKTRIGKKDIPN